MSDWQPLNPPNTCCFKKGLTALLSKGLFRHWLLQTTSMKRQDVLDRATEMEQTEQINQLGICSQDRFSKWFLFFKSSSDSPHQNTTKQKNKQTRTKGLPLSPGVPARRWGGRASRSGGWWFPLRDCVSKTTLDWGPRGLSSGRGCLFFLSHYLPLCPIIL